MSDGGWLRMELTWRLKRTFCVKRHLRPRMIPKSLCLWGYESWKDYCGLFIYHGGPHVIYNNVSIISNPWEISKELFYLKWENRTFEICFWWMCGEFLLMGRKCLLLWWSVWLSAQCCLPWRTSTTFQAHSNQNRGQEKLWEAFWAPRDKVHYSEELTEEPENYAEAKFIHKTIYCKILLLEQVPQIQVDKANHSSRVFVNRAGVTLTWGR